VKVNLINTNKSSRVRALHFMAVALVLGAALPNAWAKQHGPDPEKEVAIVAHVPFEGKSLDDMVSEEQNGKRYLYVLHAEQQGVSIVDVNKPGKPKIIGSAPAPSVATTRMTVNGRLVLLTDAGGKSNGGSLPGPDALVLWDASQPDHPKVVQRFANVTKVVSDDRGYLFILNPDGLWVVSAPRPAAETEEWEKMVRYLGGGG
jgi:hypothetical protein